MAHNEGVAAQVTIERNSVGLAPQMDVQRHWPVLVLDMDINRVEPRLFAQMFIGDLGWSWPLGRPALKAARRVIRGLHIEPPLDKVIEGGLTRTMGGFRGPGAIIYSSRGRIIEGHQMDLTNSTDPARSIHSQINSAERQILSAGGDTFYVDFIELATGLTDAKFRWVNYKDWVFFGNGTDAKKWDGSYLWNWGIQEPQDDVALALVAQGSTMISHFESGWTGGAADTTNYTQGSQGWKVTAAASTKDTATASTTLDLGSYADEDYIKVDVFVNFPARVQYVDLVLDCNDDTFKKDYFYKRLTSADLNVLDGSWTFHKSARSTWARVGATSGKGWGTIGELKIDGHANSKGSLEVTCDNWRIVGGSGPDSLGKAQGDYKFRVAYGRKETDIIDPTVVTWSHHSNMCEDQWEETIADAERQAIAVTEIPISSDPQVNRRHLYVSGGTLTDFYECHIFEDNTTTTLTYTKADSDLSVLGPIDFDREEPVDSSLMFLWGDRLWLRRDSQPNRLYWSKVLEPEAFDTVELWMGVGDDKNDGIQTAVPFPNFVVLFCVTQIWHLVGDNEDNFSLVQRNPSACLAADAVATNGQTIWFLTSDGPASYNPYSGVVASLCEQIKPMFRGETVAGIDPMDPEYINSAQGAYWNGFYVVGYIRKGQTTIDRQLWLDTYTDEVFLTDYPDVLCFHTDTLNNALLMGAATGIVYRLEWTDSDVGAEKTFDVQTEYFRNAEHDKSWGQVAIDADTNSQNLTVTAYFNEGDTSQALGTLNSGSRTKAVFPISGTDSRNMAIRFQGTINKLVRIYDVYPSAIDLPRDTRFAESDWLDLGTSKFKVFRRARMTLSAVGTVTLSLFANGDETTAVQTKTTTATGVDDVILDFSSGHKYQSVKIKLASPATFRVYSLELEVKVLDQDKDWKFADFKSALDANRLKVGW